ncbi:MAG TPA: M28 family peptidase, partial [Candidatus Kapabacteria bacterium]|nr:M28 family peptidase [Candidatus Kapabacteria bacterium]
MKTVFAASVCSVLLLFTACTHITTVPEGRAYVQYVAASTLRQHLEIIASDSLEGREMATAGERKASAYISKTFKALDLKQPSGTNGYLQTFDVVRDSIDEAFLWVGDKKFSLKKYGVTPTSYNNNADFTADTIIFVGYGIDTVQYSDYKNIDVRGKVILICEREPKIDSNHFLITGTSTKSPWSRGREGDEKKLACAKAHGARAVITYDPSFDTLSERYAVLSTGGYHPPDSVELLDNNSYFSIGNILMRQLVGEAKAKELSEAIHRRGLLGNSFVINKPIRYHFKKQSWHEKASNVVGYIEGTDKKNEYVIVSAHYDHLGKEGNVIYHGADDNGSGTSSVMTI